MEYHPWYAGILTLSPETGKRTLSGGQFDWGGRLLKGNGGAQRFSQAVWKSAIECKGIREPDCIDRQVEQTRKWGLVIRWLCVETPSLNG